MKIVWSPAAWADVGRIYAFLAEIDVEVADQAFDRLVEAPSMLLSYPRRGSRLSSVDDLEIRELRVGQYILRYGLISDKVLILRFFHNRENRP